MRAVDFIDLDLQSGDYRTTGTDAFSAPNREISSAQLARADGGVELFRRYASRVINLNGYINTDDSDSLDLAIDTLKQYLDKTGNLDLGYAGGIRRWYGSFQNVVITREANDVSRALWSGQLFCANPFATDTTEDELANFNVVDSSKTVGVTAAGTFYAIPVIEMAINDIDPDTSDVTITIGNPGESRSLSITRTFAIGDTLTINCATNQVFHNTELVQAEGQFPIWVPGSGTLEYSDDATDRDIDVVVNYALRYL